MTFTVKVSTDVYRYAFQHALSTKAEEIMGLLIGEMKKEENVLEILSFKINLRMDKQPDRVEISPDQMINATEAAEDLAKKLNRPNICVVGWYHSHPNITVWPSHVDLRTQYNYQRLDEHFVGLIFAVFNVAQTNNAHSYEMISFQSRLKLDGDGYEQVKVPHQIVNFHNEFLANHLKGEIGRLSVILLEEDDEETKPTIETEDPMSSIMKNLGKIHKNPMIKNYFKKYIHLFLKNNISASSQIQMNIATVVTLPIKEDLDLEAKLEKFVKESHWYKQEPAVTATKENGVKEKSPSKSGN